MSGDPSNGWQRLDRRMLLVQPVRELGRFLPLVLGVLVAGSTSGGDHRWNAAGLLVPVALGLLRYWTTSFRIAAGRIELRRGLLNRHVLSTPLDRVRTVDITAPPVHRLLGLTRVRVGTGTASKDDDEQVDLDGLPAAAAARLREQLLARGAAPTVGAPTAGPSTAGSSRAEPLPAEPPVVVLDPSWVRFAPFTSAGVAIAGGVLAVGNQVVENLGGFRRLDPGRIAHDAAAWPLWAALPAALVALVVAVSMLSIAGYVVTNWGFALTHAGNGWHLRRGLLTTRETTIDEERLHGVSVGEPLGLRVAGGARAAAIATGLGPGRPALLVPPAPRDVVLRAAGTVLGASRPLEVGLVGHGRRAARRRFTRTLGPAAAVVAYAALLVAAAGLPVAWLAVAALGLPVTALLAADRARALGHALVDGHVVARSGSLARRRDALALPGVIGWNLRASWFQRRAGLTRLSATTAGGRQVVTILDVPESAAVALAADASPALVAQFLQ